MICQAITKLRVAEIVALALEVDVPPESHVAFGRERRTGRCPVWRVRDRAGQIVQVTLPRVKDQVVSTVPAENGQVCLIVKDGTSRQMQAWRLEP